MKRLIVTADDFGLSPAVNEAVRLAYQKGILRYASLMVNAPAAAEAVRIARDNPGLGVGLHLELCRDSPALRGMRYFFSAGDRGQIEPAIVSQIEKFLSFGLKPTHADGHLNIHVHPVIFPILARLARRYGIPRLRLPGGEASRSLRYDGKEALPRLMLAGVFAALGARLRPHGAGLQIPRTFGLLRSGLMSEDYVLWLIRSLPEGSTEMYFHPSAASSSGPAGGHQSVTELDALLSPRVREALRVAAVELAAEPQGISAAG